MLPQDLLVPFLFTLPAYVANPSAVLWGGGTPMDFGRVARDGRRILGDGKTWRGFFGGALTGFSLGVFYAVLDGLSSTSPTWVTGRLLLAFAVMAFGALAGDVLAAFVKRRLGLERGARAPGLDQYDFLLGALLLLALADPALFTAFYLAGDRIYGLLLVIVITPVLHRAVNLLGYRMGRKKEPW